MKIKYRIKEIMFVNAPTIWVAQYRVLGIWMNIKTNLTGAFFHPLTTYCYSLDESKKRIQKHKTIMKISGQWWDKSTFYIPDENDIQSVSEDLVKHVDNNISPSKDVKNHCEKNGYYEGGIWFPHNFKKMHYKDVEKHINSIYSLIPIKKYNEENYDNKISDRIFIKSSWTGKNICDKLSKVTEENSITFIDYGKSTFYKGDSAATQDILESNIKKGDIFEIKKMGKKKIFLFCDIMGIKTKKSIENLPKYLTTDEYNEKITIIEKTHGKKICKLLTKNFKEKNIKIMNEYGKILEIGKDFELISVVSNDRNKKSLNLKRWEIKIKLF